MKNCLTRRASSSTVLEMEKSCKVSPRKAYNYLISNFLTTVFISFQGYKPSEERKSLQQTIDDQVLAEISKVELLRKYMQQLFTLRKGQYPHDMIF